MDDIPNALEGVYKTSRKRKEYAYEAQKEIHKPHKKNDVSVSQKEVNEVVSSTVLMPTNTRSRASRKTPLKITSSSISSTPVKKPRKVILPVEEE